MSDKQQNQPPAEPTPTFEEALAMLEAIVRKLEQGQSGLSEALDEYERGIRLLKACDTMLRGAERRIELLTGWTADGEPLTEPFDEQQMSLEEKQRGRGRRRSRSPAPASPPEDDVDASGRLF